MSRIRHSWHTFLGLLAALGLPPAAATGLEAEARYTLRYTRLSQLPLATYDALDATAVRQRDRLEHRLRLGVSAEPWAGWASRAEVDFPVGLVAGQVTPFVSRTEEPTSARRPFGVTPRALYLAWQGEHLGLAAGHRPVHWGLGFVVNDGAHPRVFGEQWAGTIVERLAVSWRPGWEELCLEAAADVVFADREARLVDDEVAIQGVVSATLGDQRGGVGVLLVHRAQDHARSRTAGDAGEELRSVTVDLTGQMASPVPGRAALEAFAAFEVAHRRGGFRVRRPGGVDAGRELERSSGAVVVAGLRSPSAAPAGHSLVLEWGYASGDSRPDDGVWTRFTLDPNHHVGLLLFGEVLRWKTARAADETRSPNFVAVPPPGSFRVATGGGVAGATYLYPHASIGVLRGLRADLAVLLAQTTADSVDPVRLADSGEARGFDGGPAERRLLGVEVLTGMEVTVLRRPAAVRAGAEAAVLFPGPALDNDAGRPLSTQTALVGRLAMEL